MTHTDAELLAAVARAEETGEMVRFQPLSETERHYLQQVAQAVSSLEAALIHTARRAERALEQMGRGERVAGLSTVLGQSPKDVEWHGAQVEALLQMSYILDESHRDLLQTVYTDPTSVWSL
jgi:hypothetical protein